jgi:hypothetical protein
MGLLARKLSLLPQCESQYILAPGAWVIADSPSYSLLGFARALMDYHCAADDYGYSMSVRPNVLSYRPKPF